MRRHISEKIFLAVIIPAFFFPACENKKQQPQQKTAPPPVVDVMIAQATTISNTIEANGTVVANEYVELHPEVSGRITYLNVPEGKYISAGTLIAKINDEDLQAQLSKSKVQLDLAEQTEERLKKLLDINGVNQADYDAALNQVNSLKADIAYTLALIDKTFIKAPFSGVVGLRQVSIGAYVNPAEVIATVQQLDKLKVDFTLPEEYSNYIKNGAVVTMQFDASDSVKHTATIIAEEPEANTLTRNLKIRAVLNDNTKPNPGAFVKVFLNAGAGIKAIMIPTNAIIPNDKNKQVVLVKDGNAKFANVETGIRKESNVEILKGILEGDTVVVTGVLFARANNAVKVRSVKTLDQLAAAQEVQK